MSITCDYCGKVKEEDIFIIGASSKPDWVMVYGTGKMSCPECLPKAELEAKKAEERYLKGVQA